MVWVQEAGRVVQELDILFYGLGVSLRSRQKQLTLIVTMDILTPR